MIATSTRSATTDAAEWCIRRFAALETDVASAELTGVGRDSGVRFPRLGGLLHGRVAPGSHAASLLTGGAERTIRAGYVLALDADGLADAPVQHTTPDELWAAFVPASYRIPRQAAAPTIDDSDDDERWTSLLRELGLVRDATRLARGRVSPLSRSIDGLRTVGVALAVTERAARRVARAHRRDGRPPLPASGLVLDDGR
jgi:hypothetical protein